MCLSHRPIVIALAAFALTAADLHAQGYRRQGGRAQRRFRSDDRGTERGFIVRVLSFGNDRSRRGDEAARHGVSVGKKTGTIAIKTQRGPQFSAVFTRRTEFLVENARLSPSKVKSLLVAGMPVELNWETSEDVGGRAVTTIRIRTVEIEGVIQKLSRGKVVVMARPKAAPESDTDIKVRGRRGSKDAAAKKRPKPRKLALTVAKATAVTVDGEDAKLNGLRPKMAFDALVTDGGPSLILEIHARGVKKADKKPKKERKS